MRRPIAILSATFLAAALLGACGSDDGAEPVGLAAPAAAPPLTDEANEADPGSSDGAGEADPGSADEAGSADEPSSADEPGGDVEAACKKALAKQAKANFDAAMESQDFDDPRIDRNIPAQCEAIDDPADQQRIAKEVAEELAAAELRKQRSGR